MPWRGKGERPASTYQGVEDVIRDVPVDGTKVTGGGVGEDDWGAGDGDHVPGGGRGGVGQVHHQPHPIHLKHHLLKQPEIYHNNTAEDLAFFRAGDASHVHSGASDVTR